MVIPNNTVEDAIQAVMVLKDMIKTETNTHQLALITRIDSAISTKMPAAIVTVVNVSETSVIVIPSLILSL